MDRQTDRQMYRRTDGWTDRKIRNIFLRRWHKMCFYESGTNVVFMKVALMSFFSYWWDLCLPYWRWDKRRWDKRRWQKSRVIISTILFPKFKRWKCEYEFQLIFCLFYFASFGCWVYDSGVDVQWTPLNGITLGQTTTDPINRMVLISKWASTYVIWDS